MDTMEFDPNKLSSVQRRSLMQLLMAKPKIKVGRECELFTTSIRVARPGENEGYQITKITRPIARLFGGEDRTFTTTRILYSLHHGVALKKDEKLSHLCGKSLCGVVTHLVVEPQTINDQRRDCHKAGRENAQPPHVPPCICD